MPDRFQPHDLLWISSPDDLVCDAAAPPWVQDVLQDAPVVVVRRSLYSGDLIPVGVRGRARYERYGAFLPISSATRRVTPEQLVAGQAWLTAARNKTIPAIKALKTVAREFSRFDFAWGPTGSVGFELATGSPVTKASSDLDIVLRAPIRLSRTEAETIINSLQGLDVTVDVQIETPFGCIALYEYAGYKSSSLLMRTINGPILVSDPWELPQGFSL